LGLSDGGEREMREMRERAAGELALGGRVHDVAGRGVEG
jgi:hypothetical protein